MTMLDKPMTDKQLIAMAALAREKAYAPYSGFPVGAALLARSGKVYTGCNGENASYGLSICAERVAIFKAISAGERGFKALAVVTESMATPCGACRQVLAEFGEDDMQVIVANLQGDKVVYSLAELLPASFTPPKLPRR